MLLFTEIIRHFIIAIVSILIFSKLRPLGLEFVKKASLCTGFVALTSSVLFLLTSFFNVGEPFRTAILVIIFGITFALLLRERIEKIFTALTIAFAVSYILLSTSLAISFLTTAPFLSFDASDDYLRVVVSGIISIAAAILLRKIKVDYSIIFKKSVSGIFLSLSGIVIVFYGLITDDLSNRSAVLLIVGFTILGYGIFSWFRRETTIARDENAKDVAAKKQQAIYEEKERDFAVLSKVHHYLESVVHRDDKKLNAMKRAVEKLVMRSNQVDILEDASKILKEIEMSKNKDEIEYKEKILGNKSLPLTGMQIVDAKFETVAEQAMLKSIDFELKVDGDVGDFDDIHEFEIANIVGDLTENAFIAIDSLGNKQSCRKIQFRIRKDDFEYSLSIYDSGISFDADVLLKLGTERITSRPDDGGSGIGFETIFKILTEYGASLKIVEYADNSCGYTKNIEIDFDNKSEYMIKSYRASELKKLNSGTKFIILHQE